MDQKILISRISVDECEFDYDLQERHSHFGNTISIKDNQCYKGKISLEFITSGDFSNLNKYEMIKILISKLLELKEL